MTIEFETGEDKEYFISRHIGTLSDKDLIQFYKDFFNSNDWTPGRSELVDLTQARLNQLTNSGIENLVRFRLSEYIKREAKSAVKVAVHSDNDLNFGLARIYEGLTDDRLETIKVFRTPDEAESWLTTEEQPTH